MAKAKMTVTMATTALNITRMITRRKTMLSFSKDCYPSSTTAFDFVAPFHSGSPSSSSSSSSLIITRKYSTRNCSHHYRSNNNNFPSSSSSSSSFLNLSPFHDHYYHYYYYQHFHYRLYFTNGQNIKKNDPYAMLGLQWGDGATSADIQKAFRDKARQLHPDVNKTDTPQEAHEKFLQLRKAYESLMKKNNSGGVEDGDMSEWSMSIWRQGDRIARDRTDVAGVLRKRPIPPISNQGSNYSRELGHPTGRGASTTRGEYLGPRSSKKSSSVGTGRNKWVTPKEFRPWNGGNDNENNQSENADENTNASDETKK